MLRDYQSTLNSEIEQAWRDGHRNVIGVLPTGGGKTVCMSDICSKRHAPQIAVAHRQELVGQISLALARQKLHHRIVAPENTVRFIASQHMEELGQHYYNPEAPLAVAGVDTLIRRTANLDQFLKRCCLWIVDEAHHLLASNKWGKAVEAMPQALGLGLTATPCRSDKRSLQRDRGGVFDHMVVGPSMRELIKRGYLCDYRIFAPPSDINLAGVKITGSGEYDANQLHAETEKSRIVGDVVVSYQRFMPGKNAVTFAVDQQLAEQHLAAFQAAGVPSAVLTYKTPPDERVETMRAFRRQDIKMVINQDIVGEGVDVPCIEGVIMARASASYGLVTQQFGRCLRPLPGKQYGILCDHVGNIARHGLPDAPQAWSLEDGRPPRDQLELPIRTCPNPACFMVFEGYGMRCPHCGFRPEAQLRAAPQLVEGDLEEFAPELLEKLRKDAARLVSEQQHQPKRLGVHIAAKIAGQQNERRLAQLRLREAMDYWCGVQVVAGLDLSGSYRKFYRQFGVDAATAQTLNTEEANRLFERVHHATWHDYGGRKYA
jgi:DNA repair protein RadD